MEDGHVFYFFFKLTLIQTNVLLSLIIHYSWRNQVKNHMKKLIENNKMMFTPVDQ